MSNFVTFWRPEIDHKIEELVFKVIYRALINKPVEVDSDPLSSRMLLELF